ncbi:hypothetical protein LOTGIDRAFT_202114 [Lottia gigantea]|uniref:NADH dehydrogenase (Ubiquinone) complex I, assembly factor 6 n=1 Tax=Lottia gigantea TaxID=225164 RepID=V4AI43_LOTGI|nr:hypothetical protein LOTGIDRAFT_202114 [Lottia gigantea]ESO96592.1 hypothetical protein LOTGIDRAFT_202114 [Lottia gigantea]
MEIVSKSDREHYLCSLLWYGLERRASFALRAFNVELAQVRDVVSEKQIGIMRLKFWNDTLENIYKGTPRETPVSLELSGAVHHFKLINMIEARSEQLQGKKFQTIQDVEDYGEKTMSSLNYLHLQVLGIENIHADHAASHIGKAQSLITLLRATPYHAGKRQVNLPTDLLIKNKVSEESIIRGVNDQTVKDIIYDIASTAHLHLKHARSFKNQVPSKSHLAFLSTVSCEWYLKTLQKADFNVFDSSLQQRNNMLPMKLWIQSFKKTY